MCYGLLNRQLENEALYRVVRQVLGQCHREATQYTNVIAIDCIARGRAVPCQVIVDLGNATDEPEEADTALHRPPDEVLDTSMEQSATDNSIASQVEHWRKRLLDESSPLRVIEATQETLCHPKCTNSASEGIFAASAESHLGNTELGLEGKLLRR